jgi:hypothetical protein
MIRAIVVGLLALAAADAATHKQWMNDASDAQEDYREAAAARSVAKAVDAAGKIDALMARTEAYWSDKKAADGVELSRDSRRLAQQVALLARASKFDEANDAFTKLGATCNSCHELHLEKR